MEDTGKPVQIDLVESEDVDAGILKVEMPRLAQPSISEEQRREWHGPAWSGLISATGKGGWDVSDEWNRILPDHKFVTLEEFAAKLWA